MSNNMNMIEMLNTNAMQAKDGVNHMIDRIIEKANERRKELLNQIDMITKRKTERIGKKQEEIKNMDIDQVINNMAKNVTESDTTINIDMNSDDFIKVLETIGTIKDEDGEQQYVKQIKHGIEGETLLLSGYVRNITQQITTIPITKDVEGLCLKYYSLNANMNEEDIKHQKNEERFNNLCDKMKDILGDYVEDVIIDDFEHRKSKLPLRIIDHALKESFTRKRTKVTVAINPSHEVIHTLHLRFRSDPEDKTIYDLTWLLYETHLVERDLVLPNPQSFHHRIVKLIKLGLAIFSDDDETDDEDEFPEIDDNEDEELSPLDPQYLLQTPQID